MKRRKIVALAITLIVSLVSAIAISQAHHAWVYLGYELHWAGSRPVINLELADQSSDVWNEYVRVAARDWSRSRVINVNHNESGSCGITSDCIEVLTNNYGPSGWLGLGGGNVVYDPDSDQLHWTIGVAIMNDYYYDTEPYASFYGNPLWRGTVMCQEIGHALGLSHIDEDFSTDIASCMDYAANPYAHPFAHDYEVLEEIHEHRDAFVPPAGPPIIPPGLLEGNFGQAVRSGNGVTMYVREIDELNTWVTFVTWADFEGGHD